MEIVEPALVPTDLTRLAESDPFVRQIVNAWRSGACCSLDAAVEQVKELVSVPGDAGAQRRRVDEAADKIRELDIPSVGSGFLAIFGKSVLSPMWLGRLRPSAATE